MENREVNFRYIRGRSEVTDEESGKGVELKSSLPPFSSGLIQCSSLGDVEKKGVLPSGRKTLVFPRFCGHSVKLGCHSLQFK